MGRNNLVGAWGESLAAGYLQKKRYKLLATGYRCRFGEIDIIAQKDDFIIFVEVKTRSDNYMVSGRDSVTRPKQKRIIKAAMQYLQSYKPNCQPRFDVIEITVGKDSDNIVHIENAFTAEGFYGFL